MIDNKKTSILLILRVLQEYTDENHYLTQQQIIDKIYAKEGIQLERKSIGRTIDYLIELGYDINKQKGGGCALLSREFDPSQIRFLNDALFSSKAISGDQAKEISKKLNSFLSVYQRATFNYLCKSESISRTDNKDVFWNIEVLGDAISKHKQVSFLYLSYDANGKLTPKMNGYRHHVSPFYLVNNFGKYYLLCNNSKYKSLNSYRIEYIKDIKIEDEDVVNINTLKDCSNFDITEYLNDHIYVFGGNVISATLKADGKKSFQYIYDWFSSNVDVKTINKEIYIDIKSNENALFYWLLQYGEHFTVVSPESLKKKLKEHYIKQIDKYK